MVGLDIEDFNIKEKLISALNKRGFLWCINDNELVEILIVQRNAASGVCNAFKNPQKVIFITDDINYNGNENYYYTMLQPICIDSIISLISHECEHEFNYREQCMGVLLDLGISPALKGYVYLKDAINIHINHSSYFIKDIYTIIAVVHDKNVKSVERSIRYAIEAAFNKCRVNSQEEFFKNSINPLKGKPTNAEFICRVADVIKLQG